MSRILTDRARTGCYIVSEAADPFYSREQGTLAEGNDLEAGTVLEEVERGTYTALAEGTPAAILYDNVNALEGAKRAVFSVRAMTANGAELVWPEGFDDAAIQAGVDALEEKGIVVR